MAGTISTRARSTPLQARSTSTRALNISLTARNTSLRVHSTSIKVRGTSTRARNTSLRALNTFLESTHHSFQSVSHFHSSAHPTGSRSIVSSTPAASSAPAASSSAGALNPNAASCQLALPANALTPEGLSTPWELLPPCSMAVGTQQAFAEAAVIDANGQISIYHPLIIDQGKTPQAAPVVPHLDGESQVALFFGFNGDVLTLVDQNGQDTNASPILKRLQCVNGMSGVQGDALDKLVGAIRSHSGVLPMPQCKMATRYLPLGH